MNVPSLPFRTGAVCVALTVTACGSHDAAGGGASPAPTPARVKTVRVERGSVEPTMRISGIVAPFRQIGVATALNEPITEIRVREGERVRAGEVLAILLSDDLQSELAAAQETASQSAARLAQQRLQSSLDVGGYDNAVRNARAAVTQATAAWQGARTDLERYRRLYVQGYLSQQIYAQQHVTVVQDRQAVDAANAQLATVLAAVRTGTRRNGGFEAVQISVAQSAYNAALQTVEGLRRQIARATIVSPADGVVVSINANPGEYPSGRQLFTIDDDSASYAILSASSSEALRIREGAYVSVSVPDGTVRAPGRVEALLDQIAPGSTNFTVKVRLESPPRNLRPGMPVAGVVHLPAVRGVVVPTSAFNDPMRASVFVVANGKAHQRNVHDDAEDGTHAVVRGLPPGAHVVEDGQGGVADGDAVQ